MPRKGKHKRIARSVYEDATGRSIIVPNPLTGKNKEFRYPPPTPISVMRDEADTWVRVHRGSRRSAPSRGTLNQAINKWDKLERHLVSWMERRAELRASAKLYGDR